MPSRPIQGYTFLAGLFVVAAAYIPVKSGAQAHYEVPRNADVSTSGARSIRIEAASGLLRVEGRAGLNQVRIRGIARASRRAQLEDIKLIAERRGDEVFIKADIPEINTSGVWDALSGDHHIRQLDLVIEVPSSLPLDVSDGSGEARFSNTGALTLHDGSGEVEIRSARGDVRVTDGSGSVLIDGVQGNVVVNDGSGEIKARNVTGDMTIGSDGSGNIDASGIGGTMRVDSDGSGNIDVDRVAGDFVVGSAGSGTVSYDTVKGTVDIPVRRRRR